MCFPLCCELRHTHSLTFANIATRLDGGKSSGIKAYLQGAAGHYDKFELWFKQVSQEGDFCFVQLLSTRMLRITWPHHT